MQRRSWYSKYLLSLSIPLLGILAGCHSDPVKRTSELLQQGNAYFDKGEYQKAIIEYRNALKIDPNSAELHFRLGRAYARSQAYRDAFLQYRKATELKPDYVPGQLALGEFYLVAKQPEEAVQIASKLLDKNPQLLEAELLLANGYAAKQMPKEAVEELEQASREHPDALAPHLNLAVMHAAQKQSPEAMKEFQAAVALDPRSPEAHDGYGSFLLSQGKTAEAEAQFRAAVDANPSAVQPRQMLGSFLVGQHRLPEAEDTYKSLITLEKNSPQSQFELAAFYAMTGRSADAKKIDAELARKSPDFVAARMQLGDLDLSDKDYKGAEEVANGILKDRPKDALALILRARVYLAEKRPEDAIRDLGAAQQIDGNIPVLHFVYGLAFMQAGRLELAQQSLERAIGLDPRYVDAYLALSQMMIARGQLKDALQYAQQSAAVQPNRPETYLIIGRAEEGLGNFQQAELQFNRFVQLAPRAAAGPTQLGYLYLTQKKFKPAQEQFEKALALDQNDIDALSGLSTIFRAQGQNAQAVARIQEQLKLTQSAAMYNLLGSTYAAMGDVPQAENSFQSALKLDPQNFNSYMLLGSLYARNHAVERATGEFETAVKVNPRSISGWTVLGMLYSQQNRSTDAERAYQKALDIDPNDGVAANNLASMYADEGGSLDKALQLAQRAKISLPDTPNVSDTLGWIYYKRDLYNSAVPLLEEAVRKQPESPTYRLHLAETLVKVGKKDAARTELDAALKLDSNLKSKDEVRRLMAEL